MGVTIDAGKLSEPVEVLELLQETNGWNWRAVRQEWASIELSERKRSLFSSVGIGARRAEIVLRRQELTLFHALRWRGRHLFLTDIQPQGRTHLTVTAALVELTACRANVHKEGAHTSFPAVLTEKYLRHEQLDPYAVNLLTYVLVTPKPIELQRGGLVEAGGKNYEVQLAHTLDPYKNEYEIFRKEDL